jgi:tRNA dimethylallyltransferase
MKKIIVIVGPTGVGKTKLSIELAKKFDGEIINADSTQVYKDLNIGTAKVTDDETEGIPHHLFSFIDPNDLYTVFDYQRDGRVVIDEILNREKTVIIVGGSGLYLKALLYDYKFNEEDNKISYEMYTLDDLYNKLKEIDPETDIAKNNRQRIERALTFYNENGFPITMKDGKDKLIYDVDIIGLRTDREKLYERIRRKTEVMFEAGLLQEVKNLYKNKVNGQIVHTAIGYKELYDYFDGNITLEEAIMNIKSNSTYYAKRQFTWFNNQMDVKWFDVDFNDFDKTINEVEDYLT